MQFKIFIFAISLLSCQVMLSQDTIPKNPVLTDKFIINAGLFNSVNYVKISLNGASTEHDSKQIDFNRDLDIGEVNNTFSLGFTWRFSKHWNVSTDYFRINRHNELVLEDDIEWRDLTFKEGTGVKAGFEFALYRVFVGRVIATGQHYELGGGLGAHTITITPFIEGKAFVNDRELEYERHQVSKTLPLPNIGLWFIYAPTQKISLSAKLDWFGLKVDNTAGSLWDITPSFNYQVFRNVGISASYKYLNIAVDLDKEKWQGSLDLEFRGPAISIFGNF